MQAGGIVAQGGETFVQHGEMPVQAGETSAQRGEIVVQGGETNFACGFRHAGFLAAWALVLSVPPPSTRRRWMHRVLPAVGLWIPLLVQASLNTSVIR